MYDFQFGDDRIGTHNTHTHFQSGQRPFKQMNGILCVICSNRRLLTINGWLVCFVFFKKILQFIDVAFCHSIFFYLRSAASASFSLVRPHSRARYHHHTVSPANAHTPCSILSAHALLEQQTLAHTPLPPQKFHIESLKTNTRHADLRLSFILSHLILFVESFFFRKWSRARLREI